jgi:histidine triad (HIT) family protein
MPSIFSRIVSGEIPCHKIAETSEYLAFLDVSPLVEGHTLLIPKKEIDYIFDIEDGLYKGLFLFTKKVAKAIEVSVPCKRVGIAVIGLEVPHAHIHLVPINQVGDINFSKAKLKLSDEQLAEIALKIRNAFNGS